MTDLAIGLHNFEQALTVVLGHMGHAPAVMDIFYTYPDDCVAKFRLHHAVLPNYKISQAVKVALAHISKNQKLSERLRDMSVDKSSDYYFFQY